MVYRQGSSFQARIVDVQKMSNYHCEKMWWWEKMEGAII